METVQQNIINNNISYFWSLILLMCRHWLHDTKHYTFDWAPDQIHSLLRAKNTFCGLMSLIFICIGRMGIETNSWIHRSWATTGDCSNLWTLSECIHFAWYVKSLLHVPMNTTDGRVCKHPVMITYSGSSLEVVCNWSFLKNSRYHNKRNIPSISFILTHNYN